MEMADVIYHNFFLQIMTKTMNLGSGGDVFNLALFTSSKVVEVDDVTYGITNECPETGNYVHGGYAFTNTNSSVTDVDASDWTIFDINEDASWTNATITARYAQLYDASVTNKLICLFDFGADKSSTSGTFKVVFNASGVLKLA
jgi:hypothetical protein